MKGLLKRLAPLAPDYSGAVSVLYTLGGGILINGADGCIGNVNGYDEPRFFDFPPRIYSSGLREFEAITGDENILEEKIRNTLGDTDVHFIAILGTPNSAVIASDHKGVANIIQRGKNIPVFVINTTGIETYEKGAEEAFLALAKHIVQTENIPAEKKGVNIIGASPLDVWGNIQIQKIRESLESRGITVNGVWGMDNAITPIRNSLSAKLNLVVSYSGLKAAKWLKKKYGIPYVIGVPVGRQQTDKLCKRIRELTVFEPAETTAAHPQKVLIVGDQVWTHSLREQLRLEHGFDTVHTATFFSLHKELKTERDIIIESEKHFFQIIQTIQPDILIGDPLCKKFINAEQTRFIPVPHLAVSSRLHWNHSVVYTGDNLSFSLSENEK